MGVNSTIPYTSIMFLSQLVSSVHKPGFNEEQRARNSLTATTILAMWSALQYMPRRMAWSTSLSGCSWTENVATDRTLNRKARSPSNPVMTARQRSMAVLHATHSLGENARGGGGNSIEKPIVVFYYKDTNMEK